VPIEGGRSSDGDRHVIVVDRSRCRLYELFAAYPIDGGRRWKAGSGATWSLRSNTLRPRGWTSADAAGLPIFPGLARFGEVRRGEINHALRVTVPRSRRAYIYPARHFASSLTDPSLPPMGLRVRLKASFDVRPYPRQARIVLIALKRYGMIVADNGSNWYISGAPNPHWSNDQLHTLGQVKGSSFEVATRRRSGPEVFEGHPSRLEAVSACRHGRLNPIVGHRRSRSATLAAEYPHMPWTPPPGGVDAEQM
jgi:hypothetical protein